MTCPLQCFNASYTSGQEQFGFDSCFECCHQTVSGAAGNVQERSLCAAGCTGIELIRWNLLDSHKRKGQNVRRRGHHTSVSSMLLIDA